GAAKGTATTTAKGKTMPGRPVTDVKLHEFCEKCGYSFSKPQPASKCGAPLACDKRQKANAAGEPWPGVSGKSAVAKDAKNLYPHRHPKFQPPAKPARPARTRKPAASTAA